MERSLQVSSGLAYLLEVCTAERQSPEGALLLAERSQVLSHSASGDTSFHINAPEPAQLWCFVFGLFKAATVP